MPKEFKGDSLPITAAAQGNPAGKQADEEVTFNGVIVVRKGEFYSAAYLAAIDEGCAVDPKGKPKPAEGK